ncbi:hypothetical protein ACI79G_09980 [Geodermatophilus sp. SYSU D00779]
MTVRNQAYAASTGTTHAREESMAPKCFKLIERPLRLLIPHHRYKEQASAMPSITLRISDEEHETLRAMAKWKEVTLSDLIREYSRAGVRADAANTAIREEIQKTIQQERERLERVGELLEQAARLGLSKDADSSGSGSSGAPASPSQAVDDPNADADDAARAGMTGSPGPNN